MGFFNKLFGEGDESYAGQELSMQDFRGRDLSGKDFQNAQCFSCYFQNANLQGANFRGANLMQCDFSGANLAGATFDEAQCMAANFTGANMQGTSTHKADFMGAIGVPMTAHSSLDNIEDESQKWAIMRSKLEGLAAIAPGGAVRERRDDNEMFYSGQFRNRPFRVLTSHYGALKVEVKVGHVGNFTVHYDQEAQPTHGPGDADEVWGGGSSASQRWFMGPGVFVEGDMNEIAALKMRFEKIANHFAHFLPAANAEKFYAYDDDMAIELRDDLLSGDFTQRMKVVLEFIDGIANTAPQQSSQSHSHAAPVAPQSFQEQWDDLNSDQQWGYVHQTLQSIAGFAHGQVTDDREENSKMLFTGTYLQRHFRVSSDSDGDAEIHMKISKDDDRTYLYFNYDPQAQPKQGGDPVWDADSDVRVFIAQGVYLEGSADNVAAQQSKLPAAVPNLISQMMQVGNCSRLEVDDSELEFSFFNEKIVQGHFAQRLQRMLELAHHVACELGA